ncbi:FGGY-family carbohydrate kinase [Schaalia naturae]|uniref:FGGY-family carbohydrate kinase n=1 Tax=Schaalia naturae TaxID=635203 RepID=A0ABW2SLN6_9ACTO
MAIDCSTSAAKAVVVARNGDVCASGRQPIPLRTPGMDRYEQDPADWWAAVRAAVDEAVAKVPGDDRRRIAAMCLTHQRETFALLDRDGAAQRPAILWLDSRAGDQIRRLGSPHVHELSGKQPDTTPALYKIAWIAQNEPSNIEHAERIVDVHAFLAHRLTGRWVSSTASADSLGLFDVRRRTWAPELLRLAGLRPSQMPGLAEPGAPIAPIRPELQHRWGLADGIPLIAGLGDGQAAGLGAAAIRPGIAYLNVGTSIVCGVHASGCLLGSAYRTLVSGIPGRYVLESVQNSGSVLLNWFREELGDPGLGGSVDPDLEREASAVAPGSEGLITLPYWNAVQTPFWNPFARGAMIGFGSGHTRAHAYRSLMEGMAFELCSNLERMADDLGHPVTELHAMGGGSRSALWRSILADATGLPLILSSVAEVSAHGAAVLAMAAVGAYPSAEAAAEGMCHRGERTDPDPGRAAEYRRWHAIQREFYPAVKDMFERIRLTAGPDA